MTIFDELDNIEALEIVRKANQLEEEFEANFLHLPQLQTPSCMHINSGLLNQPIKHKL